LKRIEIRQNKTLLKIISLLLAAFLWIYVVNQPDINAKSSNLIETRLEYYNLGESLSVEGPSTVGVRVWGVHTPEAVTAYVDLTGLDEGSYTLDVKVKPIEGALLTRVEPDQVEVRISRQQKRILPIQHEVKVNPPEGYSLTNVMIIPEKCVIQGEDQYVKNVASVVAPLDLGNNTSLSEDIIKLEARGPNGKVISEGIKLVPESVKVYTVIEALREKLSIKVEPRLIGNPAEGYIIESVTVEPSEVEVVGAKNQISRIESIPTQDISIEGLSESFTSFVDLQAADNMIVYPSQVKLTARIKKINTNEEGKP